MEQQPVAAEQYPVLEVGAVALGPPPQRQHVDPEAAAKCRLVEGFTGQRAVRGQGDLGHPHVLGKKKRQVDRVFFDVQLAPVLQLMLKPLQPSQAALDDQGVPGLQDLGWRRGQQGPIPARDAHHVEAQDRPQAAFGEALAHQGDPGRHPQPEHAIRQSVLLPQIDPMTGFRRPVGRQQVPSDQHHEQGPGGHDGQTDRGEVEQRKGGQAVVAQGFTDQDVGRGADLGCQPAQQRPIGQRQE